MTDRHFPDWQDFYRTQPAEGMPWFFPTLDPDVERALQQHAIGGRALDLGTGPATQAIALAERGFDVTATDISEDALHGGRARADAAGVRVQFLVDDITGSQLDQTYDLILDRGCFHVLGPGQRGAYVKTVARLVEPSGYLLLKCFSDEQPGDSGPYHFTPTDIVGLFEPAFTALSVERTVYHGTFQPPPRALFCVLRRTAA
jgi:SAM-dependent methyltransferase